MAIPLSSVINITPSVLKAGGTGLDLSGLVLTRSAAVPFGAVQAFTNATDVASFFGPTSDEAAFALTYFTPYSGALITPGRLLFAQAPVGAVQAYLRGVGGISQSLGLTGLQGLPATTIVLAINGTNVTSGNINLSAATSFTNAATIIQTAIGTTGVTVSYDSILDAFYINAGNAGASSSIGYVTNNSALANRLGFNATGGGVLSQGSAMIGLDALMDVVVTQTQQFVTVSSIFEGSTSNKQLLAQWVSGKGNRYAYIMWDSDGAPTTATDTTSAGRLITAAGYSGIMPIWSAQQRGGKGYQVAAFTMGVIGSTDFARINGRTTPAFKTATSLTADVFDNITAQNLLTNGYSFIGSYGSTSSPYVFLYNGRVTGQFAWIDSYVDQIWLNNQLQASILNLLLSTPSIPYNPEGYALIESACLDIINQAVRTGVIRAGVTLSDVQRASINGTVGYPVDDVITNRGWYFYVGDPGPIVRAARGSPIATFYYCDGGAIQAISLASVEVQ